MRDNFSKKVSNTKPKENRVGHNFLFYKALNLGYRTTEYGSDLEDKLQIYNKINGAIRRHFGITNEQRNKVKNSQHYS